MKKIAIIGTGVMGAGMAANFLKKGYEVHLWNRSQDKLAGLINQGGIAAPTPKAATEAADIVFEVTADDASSRALMDIVKEPVFAGAANQS